MASHRRKQEQQQSDDGGGMSSSMPLENPRDTGEQGAVRDEPNY